MVWEENPVITTMDSIAAPIQGIQIPTLTVCENEGKPSDNLYDISMPLNSFVWSICADFK